MLVVGLWIRFNG